MFTARDRALARARRIGVTPDELSARLEYEKWCYACQAWHPRSEFGRDRSRRDGLAAMCLRSRKAAYKRLLISKAREAK